VPTQTENRSNISLTTNKILKNILGVQEQQVSDTLGSQAPTKGHIVESTTVSSKNNPLEDFINTYKPLIKRLLNSD
jgi:hypothetical protein